MRLSRSTSRAVRLARHDDRAAAVHDARRSLKRLRAMLRLVRPALGETWFKQSNRQLAGLGQRLSQSRDLDVMVVTRVQTRERRRRPGKGRGGAAARCVARGRSLANGAGRPASDRTLGGGLQRAEKLFAAERLRGLAFVHVAAGLAAKLPQGAARLPKRLPSESDEAFHSWRKATQAHWRHMQLLGRGWPESIGARAAEAKELSRLLGEDHDLSVLLGFAQATGSAGLSAEDLAALTAACLSCQRQIRDIAKPHGERLYADRPRQLTKRIVRYWQAAEELSSLLPPAREHRKSPARRPASQRSLARPGSARLARRLRQDRHSAAEPQTAAAD